MSCCAEHTTASVGLHAKYHMAASSKQQYVILILQCFLFVFNFKCIIQYIILLYMEDRQQNTKSNGISFNAETIPDNNSNFLRNKTEKKKKNYRYLYVS
jgi:hypothetical protein